MTVVDSEALKDFAVRAFEAVNVPREDAEIAADSMVEASLRGEGDHGARLILIWCHKITEGGTNPLTPIEVVRDNAATALLDAAKGFGYVAGQRAMSGAIQKARKSGIGMVGVCNSNHFGIAGYHAMLAARNDLIGIAQTNAGAEMAPWGAMDPALGTNPWGIAIPRSKGNDPILLDMALTQSGKGMMRWFERAGVPMPDNWALTPDGTRTTDPGSAMQGSLLPIGEHKGYGLSLVTDVLCGVMTGALFGGCLLYTSPSPRD